MLPTLTQAHRGISHEHCLANIQQITWQTPGTAAAKPTLLPRDASQPGRPLRKAQRPADRDTQASTF